MSLERPVGLVCGYRMDSMGQSSVLSIEAEDCASLLAATAPGSYVWLHFDIRDPEAQAWLSAQTALSSLARDTLLSDQTRPHVWLHADTWVMALRSVNLAPNAALEDMVAVRIYADSHLIITTRRRSLLALSQLATDIASGKAPVSVEAFLIRLTQDVTAQLGPVLDHLDERLDRLEEGQVGQAPRDGETAELDSLRRNIIVLRRYLAPQRDAFARLLVDYPSWVTPPSKLLFGAISEHSLRCLETLDALRDRAAVAQDSLSIRTSNQLNRRIYLLSVIAVIFLPLSFWINLFNLPFGGQAWVQHPGGGFLLLITLGLTALLQILFLRRKGWL